MHGTSGSLNRGASMTDHPTIFALLQNSRPQSDASLAIKKKQTEFKTIMKSQIQEMAQRVNIKNAPNVGESCET
jgi:hypothetical protein